MFPEKKGERFYTCIYFNEKMYDTNLVLHHWKNVQINDIKV